MAERRGSFLGLLLFGLGAVVLSFAWMLSGCATPRTPVVTAEPEANAGRLEPTPGINTVGGFSEFCGGCADLDADAGRLQCVPCQLVRGDGGKFQ